MALGTFTQSFDYGYRIGGKSSITGGNTGGAIVPSDGSAFFDDFLGHSLDQAKWTGGVPGQPEFDRQGDLDNSELDAVTPTSSNISLTGSILSITARFEDKDSNDRDEAFPHDFETPLVTYNYTSGQIQSRFKFLYGTVSARLKPPVGGQGVWPCFWMLGENWQASQPYTANGVGENWPVDAWCETDIAEFLAGHRTQVNNIVHYNASHTGGENSLGFDASAQFAVYRLQWSAGSMIWSRDAEDGNGFVTTQTASGSQVPSFAQYIVFNMAVGGAGGTPNPAGYPANMQIDWVRVTQP
jgi:beta-glucanase (GH16 family)